MDKFVAFREVDRTEVPWQWSDRREFDSIAAAELFLRSKASCDNLVAFFDRKADLRPVKNHPANRWLCERS